MAENNIVNINVAAVPPPSSSSKDKKKSASRVTSSPSEGNVRVPGPSSVSEPRYGRPVAPSVTPSSSAPRYGRPVVENPVPARATSSSSVGDNTPVPGPSSVRAPRYGGRRVAENPVAPTVTPSSSAPRYGRLAAGPPPRYSRSVVENPVPSRVTPSQSVSRPLAAEETYSSSMGNTHVPAGPSSLPPPRYVSTGRPPRYVPPSRHAVENVSRPAAPRVSVSCPLSSPVGVPAGPSSLPPSRYVSTGGRRVLVENNPAHPLVAPRMTSSPVENTRPSSLPPPLSSPVENTYVSGPSSIYHHPRANNAPFPPPLSVGSGSRPAVGPSSTIFHPRETLQPSLDRGITAVLQLESHNDYVGFEKGAIVRYYGLHPKFRHHYMKDFVVVCSNGGRNNKNPQYRLESLDTKGDFFHPTQNTLVLLRNPE